MVVETFVSTRGNTSCLNQGEYFKSCYVKKYSPRRSSWGGRDKNKYNVSGFWRAIKSTTSFGKVLLLKLVWWYHYVLRGYLVSSSGLYRSYCNDLKIMKVGERDRLYITSILMKPAGYWAWYLLLRKYQMVCNMFRGNAQLTAVQELDRRDKREICACTWNSIIGGLALVHGRIYTQELMYVSCIFAEIINAEDARPRGREA